MYMLNDKLEKRYIYIYYERSIPVIVKIPPTVTDVVTTTISKARNNISKSF